MTLRKVVFFALSLSVLAFPTNSCSRPPRANARDYVFGLLLVGPKNDRGWSESFFSAGRYVEQKLPGTKMVYIDKVNPGDRPGSTTSQLAEELLRQGARFIIFNSDDMKDEAVLFARRHPDIPVLHASGDTGWKGGKNYIDLPNLGNFMGRMETCKMMAGFSAALTSKTGRIGYLGPLINDETRRLAAAAYLGARYAWTHVLGKNPDDLRFRVTWIGFWFYKPGETEDPSQVSHFFFKDGFDVIISGLDTTECLAVAARQTTKEKPCFAVTYGYEKGGAEAPDVCLGSLYFNWGPELLHQITAAREGRWKPEWQWEGPDLSDLNNPDKSAVSFLRGAAMPPAVARSLDDFIRELRAGLNLWTGPLRFQDGTAFLKPGQIADDPQVWYLPLLLEGMEGQSVPGR